MFYLYSCAIIALILLALFFGFKYKQVEGADYKNKRLRDRHGSGSFSTAVSNFFAKIIWGGLVIVAILLGIFFFAKISEIDNANKIDSQNLMTSQPSAILNKDNNLNSNKLENTREVISPSLENASVQLQNKIYTDQELKNLEEKAQYNGDDPIIRMRLGLPPKQ